MGEGLFNFNYIENFIKPYILSNFDKDEPILLGLSGGADSTLLLYMLLLYREETGALIYAAHIQHGIRGEEAIRDLEFCRRLCSLNSVEFFELSIDVPKLAQEQKKSIEHCARDVRYDFFNKIMSEKNIKILATAHNSDDNIETLLFNIMRGTGIHGACGIPPYREFGQGLVIRPLINIEKEKILEFCKHNNIEYVTDSTNEKTDYSRNYIRANIIPLMKKCNPNVNENISRFCGTMRKNADFIKSQAEKFILENINNGCVPQLKLCMLDEALLSEVIMQMYNSFCGGSLEFVHVEAVLQQLYSQKKHFTLDLPNHVFACCKNSFFSFDYLCNKNSKEDYNIKVNDFNQLYFINDYIVEFTDKNKEEIQNSQIDKNIYKLATSTYINFGSIKYDLYLRNKRDGDTIYLNSMHKKIKKLFCDNKIPIEIREELPLLCSGDEVLWVPFIGACDNLTAEGNKCQSVIKLYTMKNKNFAPQCGRTGEDIHE